MRHCDTIEELNIFKKHEGLPFGQPLEDDIINIIKISKKLSQLIGITDLKSYEQSLFFHEDPYLIGIETISWILGISSNDMSEAKKKKGRIFSESFITDFKKIKSPIAAIDALIKLLDTIFLPNQTKEKYIPKKSYQLDTIVHTAHHLIENRFQFSLELSLFIFYLSSRVKIGTKLRQKIENIYIYKIVSILKNYYFQNLIIQTRIPFLPTYQIYLEKNRDFEKAIEKYSPQFKSPLHELLFHSQSILDSLWFNDENQKQKALEISYFIYKKAQYNLLQEFARLNVFEIPQMNHFIGLCYVENNSPYKARDYFIQTGLILLKENPKYIFETFKVQSDNYNDQTLSNYYLQIAHLLYLHPDVAIEFGNLSLYETTNQEQINSILTLLFHYYILLERFDEAYVVLIKNTNAKTKKADLSRFINTLYEKKRPITQYPFIDMVNDVDSILLMKAKTMNIHERIHFYDILYSFHTYKGNHTKASQMMYEFSKRIQSEEANDMKMLERQSLCLLTAINSLSFVDSEYQWIIHRDSQTKIVTIEDMKKENLLLSKRIIIYEKFKRNNILNAFDSMIDLIQLELYDDALDVIEAFNLDKTSLFQSLATKFALNNNFKEKLEYYLEKFDKQGFYTRIVVDKIYSLKDPQSSKDTSSPPQSLINKLTEKDPSSLLLIYLKYDIEKAKDLIDKKKNDITISMIDNFESFKNIFRVFFQEN